jgi:hypothetical protein
MAALGSSILFFMYGGNLRGAAYYIENIESKYNHAKEPATLKMTSWQIYLDLQSFACEGVCSKLS